MQLRADTRSASVNAVTPLWEGGTIVFKTGAPGTTGTTIVTVPILADAFPSASSGVSTAPQAKFSQAQTVAAGTVGQYEVFTSAATGSASVCFGSVGLQGAIPTPDFIFTDTLFNNGDYLQITSVTYTQPAS